MAKYSSLENMYESFKAKVKDVVEEVVPPIMKEKMSEAVELEVYMRYSPTLYERRGDEGGLSDIRNMNHSINIEGNKIIIRLINNTLGNDDYKYHSNDYIDMIVATGDGYNWKQSNIYDMQPYPRNFYQKTTELLRDNTIRKEIINKLRTKGIIVK